MCTCIQHVQYLSHAKVYVVHVCIHERQKGKESERFVRPLSQPFSDLKLASRLVSTPLESFQSHDHLCTGNFRSIVGTSLWFIMGIYHHTSKFEAEVCALGMYCISYQNDTTFLICEWWGWSFSVGQCSEFHWPHSWQQCLH